LALKEITMVDTVHDPEELAEEEGGSGMPMTDSAEIAADVGDDIEEDADSEDAHGADPEDDETDDEAIEEASA
jgi:cobalamin biosynthesis protein CobT